MKEVEFSNGRWTKKYYIWQAKVFLKDDYKCLRCGSSEKLHAHHIMGWNEAVNLRYEVSNGLTLCASCHARHHGLNRIPWNKGKKASEETKKKLSDAHLGQKAWNKGKKMSPEYVQKMSEVRMGIKRGPHSEEWKRKIGEANKATLLANAAFRKGKTWIKCKDTGKRIWLDKADV